MDDDQPPLPPTHPSEEHLDPGVGSVQRVGTVAAEHMAELEAVFGSGVRIGAVAVLTEIITVDEDKEVLTYLRWRMNDPRPWAQAGFFGCARDMAAGS